MEIPITAHTVQEGGHLPSDGLDGPRPRATVEGTSRHGDAAALRAPARPLDAPADPVGAPEYTGRA